MSVTCKINGKAKRRPADDGSCPACTLPDVPLTGKGFIATHPMPITLGEGPQIPLTDTGTRIGDPRDAAVRREIDALHNRAQHAPAPTAAPDPVQTTGHGRGPVLVRGRAMQPVQPTKGYAAAAGTLAGSLGRERSERPGMVGGRYGYLEPSQYAQLSRTQQRKYWAKVKKMQDHGATRRHAAVERLGTGGAASHGFADAASRETEALMRQPRS